jgi:hypothetical protein
MAREQQQRRTFVPRVATLLAVFVLGSAAFGAEDAEHSNRNSSDALSRALVSGHDLPGQWNRFRPRGSTKHRECGLKHPQTPKPRSQASTAWIQDPKDGPVFGERIEVYAKGKADIRLQRSKTLPLPCEWDEFKTRWRATAEPPINLGNDNWVYVIETLTGTKGFTYEIKLRRGDTLVSFALGVRQPQRDLLEELVSLGWAKADARLGALTSGNASASPSRHG